MSTTSPGRSARCSAVCILLLATMTTGCSGLRGGRPGDRGGGVLFRDGLALHAPSRCLSDGDHVGAWEVRFTGNGCVSVRLERRGASLQLAPQAAQGASATHAALVLGPHVQAPLTVDVRTRTDRQLREGAVPNPWEVGWLVWHYLDDEHFYYLIAKPNGWELGKRDPAYPGGQRFLATGGDAELPVGRWTRLRVRAFADGRLRVYVNSKLVAEFVDDERPYRFGRIGVYAEDAMARFRDIVVRH